MRPIRLFEEDKLYFITNRTIQGRLLLRPSPLINKTIGAILARGLNLYSVRLYAFVFTSNHFHIILSGHPRAIARFMSHLQSNIARQVGAMIDWRAKFWGRRYSAEPILDNDALVGRLQYIFEHGPKEGLVQTAQKWPGLTCIPELTRGKQRTFKWFHKSRYQLACLHRKNVNRKDFEEELPLTLTPFPHWEHLSKLQRQNLARETLDAANHSARVKRDGKPPLGLKKVLAQHPHTRPKHSKRSKRPWCHTTCPQLRKAFKKQYREFLQYYWEASELYIKGVYNAAFPPGTFKPPIEA